MRDRDEPLRLRRDGERLPVALAVLVELAAGMPATDRASPAADRRRRADDRTRRSRPGSGCDRRRSSRRSCEPAARRRTRQLRSRSRSSESPSRDGDHSGTAESITKPFRATAQVHPAAVSARHLTATRETAGYLSFFTTADPVRSSSLWRMVAPAASAADSISRSWWRTARWWRRLRRSAVRRHRACVPIRSLPIGQSVRASSRRGGCGSAAVSGAVEDRGEPGRRCDPRRRFSSTVLWPPSRRVHILPLLASSANYARAGRGCSRRPRRGQRSPFDQFRRVARWTTLEVASDRLGRLTDAETELSNASASYIDARSLRLVIHDPSIHLGACAYASQSASCRISRRAGNSRHPGRR